MKIFLLVAASIFIIWFPMISEMAVMPPETLYVPASIAAALSMAGVLLIYLAMRDIQAHSSSAYSPNTDQMIMRANEIFREKAKAEAESLAANPPTADSLGVPDFKKAKGVACPNCKALMPKYGLYCPACGKPPNWAKKKE